MNRSQHQPIRFFHRGQVVEVSNAHPTRTLLDWLREDAHCTGTKEGCNEGDCGACTVVLGELVGTGAIIADGASSAKGATGLQLQTVNACIQFLPTLDGKALFTVEDLKAQCGRAVQPQRHDKHPVALLHPVQQAMVDCHGSQCGFCTPGFVMSLWSTYELHQAAGTRPTRRQLADDLSGNLCRCTGYRPILDAGERMFDLPPIVLDRASVIAQLQALRDEQGGDGLAYAAPVLMRADNASANSDDGAAPEAAERMDQFHAPTTIEQLATLRLENPDARLFAGATDVGLWVNKQFRDVGDLIYVGNVRELKSIEVRGEGDSTALFIGAGASLEATYAELARRLPSLTDIWLRFASPPIRNAGTLGGNIANGSPIGDSAPVALALDAEIELRRGERVRRMALTDFYTGYMTNRLEPGEFVQGLSLPLAAFERHVRAYKISKRYDSDISALCGAFSIALEGDVVRTVRLAFGGMAVVVKRAAAAEVALVGQPWSEASVARARSALTQDFEPLSDLRASANHRQQVAQNLLTRFWLETRRQAPLGERETSVWSGLQRVPSAFVPMRSA